LSINFPLAILRRHTTFLAWQIFSDGQKRAGKEKRMQQQKVRTTAKAKANTRISTRTQRAPRQAHREATRAKEARDPNAPVFVPCSLQGPDGQQRPGWEMWVGEILFGRADTKESLLQYYARIHEPMPSGHWKDRSWQSSPKLARQKRTAQYEGYDDELQMDSENDLTGVWD
jgi:hypothetical protein